jgi:acyl-coenzyme A synthetase/AMP-(fatty) acid ligase
MLRQPLPALPRLRHGLSAGETLPPELRRHWREATGTDIHEAIGLSECSTFVSGSPGSPAPEGSTGYPQPGRRIAVLADGKPAPQGTLAVHRSDPGLMLGYWGDPEATARRFADDWFLTGDVVAADPDGALRYLGREDDQMNAGGFRVSPLEVEMAMAACPGIGEVAVTEVEVRPGVRVIGCFHTGAADDPAGHAARHLARWKAPRLFIRLDALPRNANNKLNRRALAALVPKEGR